MPLRIASSLFSLAPPAGLLLLLVLLAACTGSRPSVDEPPEAAYRLVGYVFGPRSTDLREIDATRLTHVNYAFANVDSTATVQFERASDPANIAQLNALRAANPDLQLLYSIGGWGWSDHFSDAALTDSSRQHFARTAVDLMVTYAFDGIDVDWEYPGQPGEGNTFRPEDKQHFTLLLQTLREHLDARGTRDGRHYLLTIATGANDRYLANTDLGEAHRYLDFINIMTYDFFGGYSEVTGHHANLFPSAAEGAPPVSAAAAVERHVEAGVPPAKLVLGVPFYGKGWHGVRAEDHGRYQPYTGAFRSYSYCELAADYVDANGYVRYWDEGAQAPYLWNADSSAFITYDDPASMRRKAAYVREQGLGGVMYWEHHADSTETLLRTLYEALAQ